MGDCRWNTPVAHKEQARVGKTISSHQFPPQKDEGVSQT